jgi:hypothetical protein
MLPPIDGSGVKTWTTLTHRVRFKADSRPWTLRSASRWALGRMAEQFGGPSAKKSLEFNKRARKGSPFLMGIRGVDQEKDASSVIAPTRSTRAGPDRSITFPTPSFTDYPKSGQLSRAPSLKKLRWPHLRLNPAELKRPANRSLTTLNEIHQKKKGRSPNVLIKDNNPLWLFFDVHTTRARAALLSESTRQRREASFVIAQSETLAS